MLYIGHLIILDGELDTLIQQICLKFCLQLAPAPVHSLFLVLAEGATFFFEKPGTNVYKVFASYGIRMVACVSFNVRK